MARYWIGHVATVAAVAAGTYFLGEQAKHLMNGNLSYLNQAKDSLISIAELGVFFADIGYFFYRIPAVRDQEYQLTREDRQRRRQGLLDMTEDINDLKDYRSADRAERRQPIQEDTADIAAETENERALRGQRRQPIVDDSEDLRAGTRREIEARRFSRERRRPY